MEINVLQDEKTKFVVELVGESHSICNMIRKQLWQDKNVNIAGYAIDHPLTGSPKITVETTSGSAKDAFLKAVKAISKDTDSFLKSFNKEVK